MEKTKITLRELLVRKQVVAPDVFDNISVRAVELAGFEAAFLSGEGMALSMCGFPDKELLNVEELVFMTSRMTSYTTLPVVVDLHNGYGNAPLHAYTAAARMAKAGAHAVIISDSAGTKQYRAQFSETENREIISREAYAARIKAAVEACKDTDCMVIARSEAMRAPGGGLDEAIERCLAARALGAEITLVDGLKTLEEGRRVAQRDTGMKVWPNIGVTDGVPDVSYEEIDRLGFRLVGMNYAIKGALFGMLEFGRRSLEDGNTVYHDTHDFDGLLERGQDYHTLFSFWKKWLPMERKFNDLSEIEDKTYDIRF